MGLDMRMPTVGLTCDTGTIPNTTANMKIVYYNQSDYSDVSYGAGGISGSGCAICSFAMALCYVTQVVWTPDSLLNYIQANFGSREAFYSWNDPNDHSKGGSGTDTGSMISKVIPKVAADFPNLKISYKAIGKSEIVNELTSGHPVVMSCKNPGYEKGTKYRMRWASSTHIVLLSGVDSYGNIYCHNCGRRDLIGEPYTIDEVDSIVNNGYWAIRCNPAGTYRANIDICNKSMGSNAGKSAYTGGAVSSAQVSSSSGTDKSFLGQVWDGITNAVDSFSDWAKGLVNGTFSYSVQQSTYEYEYATKSITYTTQVYKSANQTEDVQNTGLLTYPTLVESPFVQFKVGDYTFGTYVATASGKRVRYPNYIDSMTVKKINGTVNQYTINLFHQIEAGADPNFVEKIFSSVGYGAEVYISYGDYNAPSMIYREEAAILQKVTSQVDFKSSRISYTVSCTSNATKLYAQKFSFPKVSSAKPSDIINQMLWGSGESTYGLKDVFPGMYTRGEDGSSSNYGNRTKFIASDDKAVEIAEKKSMDPLSYINYLVTCMCCTSNTDDSSVLKDSTYKLCLYDTNFSSDGDAGAYFKVVKIPTSTGNATTLQNKDIYEVDIGYPTDSMVMNFSIKTDQSWAMLYKYADETREMQYVVNEDGKLSESYVPSVALSTVSGTMTESQRTWWTNMTRFPIQAELELKGLVRPTILMSYVRINALFYGQRHISSGLYYISAQTDSISGSGYRTTLSLTRIAGDDDVVETVEKKKDVKYVKTVKKVESEVTGSILVDLGLFSNGTESAASYQYEGTTGSDGSTGTGYGTGNVATNYSITIDPKTVNGSSNVLAPDMYPIYAALRVMTQNSDKTVMMYALSAALCRINDYKNASYPNLRLYEFIHMNKKVLASYANTSNPHYNVNLFNLYKGICDPESNSAQKRENDIFNQNAAYAYDAANSKLAKCANQREKQTLIKESIVFLDSGGIEVTLPPPSGELLNALYSIISSGTVCTIANYFSLTFTTLKVDSDDTIKLSSNSEITANRNIDKYWKPGDTYLIDSKTGVSGYFLQFPSDECDIPFIVQKDLWGDRGNISASSALQSSGTSGDWQADAWRIFRASGMTPQGAAGALGNMMHESAGNGPTSVEIAGFSSSLIKYHKYNWNSQSDVNTGITQLIDTGAIMSNAANPNDPTNKFLFRKAWFNEGESYSHTYWGYGLCQWTTLERKLGLYNFSKQRGTSIGDILTQINYVVYELSPEKAYFSLLSELKSITDVDLAAKQFFAKFEFGASSYEAVSAEYKSSLDSRVAKAREAYANYSSLG